MVLDPNALMFWVDKWKDITDSFAGKIDGKLLRLIAIQRERRLWKRLIGRKIKNWIYYIEGTRLIVYKEFPKSAGAMKMGLSGHFLKTSGSPYHKFAVPMETYARYFLDNIDPDWLKRNDYELI